MKLPALHHFLPALPETLPEDLFQAIRGYLDHELAHVAGNSSFAIGADFKKRFGPEGFGLLNCLEDARIEAFMRGRFPGSAANLMSAYRYAAKTAAEQTDVGKPLPVLRQLAFAIHTRANGLSDVPFVEPRVYEAATRIKREIQGSVNAPNTKVVAKLAEAAWPVVKELLEKDPAGGGADTAPGDPTKKTQSWRSSRSDPQQADHGKINDSATAQPPSATANSEDGKASATSDGAVPAAGTPPPGVDEDSVNGIFGTLGQEIAAAVSRYSETTGAYRVWSTAHDTVTVPDNPTTGSHPERIAPLMRHVAGVRQRLLQTLMAEARVRWLPDRESGTLNPRALHRLAATHWIARQGTSAPQSDSLSRRVFRERVVAKRFRTAVMLLVDESHSMNGRKLNLARDTALVLCEAMDRLDVPVSVIGFSTAHYGKILKEAAATTGVPADTLEKQYRFAPLVHEVYKRFEEPFRRVSGRFSAMRTHMLTPLGESMLFAARELARRPEPRKVLLVLTDGRPTVGMDNDAITYRHAKDSIIRIEKAGIDVALIGMLEPCVQDLHHRAVVVNDLDSLPNTVMKQLQQLLARDPSTPRPNNSAGASTC